MLKTAGNHIAVHLAQARSENLLSEARQFEAYNRLTAFLMHDLNNLIAQQSLIVSNAEKHKRNPEFVDDAIDTIARSVDRMKNVMEQLRHGRTDRTKKRVELRFLASRAIERCGHRPPIPELVYQAEDIAVEIEGSEFVSILANLVKNAQEATDAAGMVTVSLDRDGSSAIGSTFCLSIGRARPMLLPPPPGAGRPSQSFTVCSCMCLRFAMCRCRPSWLFCETSSRP